MGALPDLTVRAVQLYLTYLGYHPGGIDGVAGVHTLSALTAFQQDQGSPAATTIDDECVSQLAAAFTGAVAAAAWREVLPCRRTRVPD